MRALCLLALIGATLSGCCSTHRAWSDGYGSCVSGCGDCSSNSHKGCLFKKHSSRGRCSHCSPCGDSCGFGCGSCETACGSNGDGCSSCSNDMVFEGMASGGCSSCAQGQTVYDGSTYSTMPSSTTCPTCQQNQMIPSPSQSIAPIPPAPPATPANPMQNAPEPTAARMMQPMQMQQMQPVQMVPMQMVPQPQPQPQQMQPLRMAPVQTQPVQYQEWQPHQTQNQTTIPYTPPAQAVSRTQQTAVQPVLWVPAQTQTTPAPLLLPAR